MAASAWQLYNAGKRYIGNGTITLGAGSFKMALFNSASNTSTFTLSTFASLTGQISATGGYVSGGKELVPATGQWTVGASATQMKFTYSTVGLTFTASGSALTNIKYAVIDALVLRRVWLLHGNFCASASFPQANSRWQVPIR
jgi:hypothetical protein